MLKFNSQFLVNKKDISITKTIRTTLDTLKEGECLFQIERFGFSANNTTYMALGHSFEYFKFFTSNIDGDWASVPVWGMAKVVEATKGSNLKVGEQVYGYWPSAQYIILKPIGVKSAFFYVDRPQLPADRRVYNQYFRASTDVEYSREREEAMMLFRPLWGTSFFLDDFLMEKEYFHGKTILISSASSKTAYCLALILHDKKKMEGGRGPRIVGLTSGKNISFVKELGWYDEVIDYKDLEKSTPFLTGKGKIVYCDLAADPSLNSRIRKVLGQNLVMSVSVGMSHYSAKEEGKKVDFVEAKDYESKAISFFAPEWIKIRVPRQGDDLVKRREEAWARLLRETDRCVSLEERYGPARVEEVYKDFLKGGGVSPKSGFILSLWEKPLSAKL